MATNIGIGIANAIGFNRRYARGNILPKPIAAWSAAGKTNEDEDRAVLKDLTGNGHDITLKGFAFSEMSGYGGYVSSFTKTGSFEQEQFYSNKAVFNGTYKGNFYIFGSGAITTSEKIDITLKLLVKNISQGQTLNWQVHYTLNEGSANKTIKITEDGLYTLDSSVIVIPEGKSIVSVQYYRFFLGYDKISVNDLTIELLPEYPDALVFDGVDDYGICENMPILTDYTIIAKRKYVGDYSVEKRTICSKGVNPNKAFNFELSSIKQTDSFGSRSSIIIHEGEITWQNKTSYNQQKIKVGTSGDSSQFYLGSVSSSSEWYFNGAFYSAYLFDRSLTEEEIKAFIRKNIDPSYLLPSEIPTPDCYYDFSLGSNDDTNREVVKDQSGNGNDAKIYNCAFNEDGSGYKDGALYLDGVDDYVALEAFDSGFKTIFMLCNPFALEGTLYDQRKDTARWNYAIYSQPNTIGYKARNTHANVNMINGIPNTVVKVEDLLNKKQLITTGNNDLTNSKMPKIGIGYVGYPINMAIYKFLGFKEALNEDQIKAVIQKYNLLDGVDDIQVS